jgi:hypothetical protein
MRTLRQPRRSRRISVQTPSPPAPKSWRKWLRNAGAACVAIVGFVAAIIGIGTICWPRMVADASGLFDDANPYSVSFTVSNTGWIPLRNVRLSVALCSLTGTGSSWKVIHGPQYRDDKCGVGGLRIGNPWRWERHELLPDGKFTINLSDELSTPLTDKIESDDELINRALSDAPEDAARSATVISMGGNGEIRTLRQGTGQWTCTPGPRLLPHPPYPISICSQDRGRVELMATYVDRLQHGKPGFIFRNFPKFEGADVALIVSYQPWFLSWNVEKRFRFTAEKQPNDKIMWRQLPMR